MYSVVIVHKKYCAECDETNWYFIWDNKMQLSLQKQEQA